MTLQLFNTLSRKKEVFKPISPGKIKMYCCGPTVYNYAHIGNLRTYVFEDILRRVLEYNKYQVTHAMNVTDVGHLTSDEDEGEDKIEMSAKKEGKTPWEIAEYYTEAFFDDTKKINILKPTIICKATEHIQQMIDMIQTLEKNGYTYTSEGNVYFDIGKFPYYRDLGRLNLEELKSTERVQEDAGKKNPHDFVLWFTKSKFKNQVMIWDSPWGQGYPGWHIECSAMSTHYLGPHFDIHCGGVDHIQVHHTNEIAQSECCYENHPSVNYWLHGEFLIINNARMGKSQGNFITINTLEEEGFEPIVYRYFCLTAHYRQKLNFTWEALEHAQNGLETLRNKLRDIKSKIAVDKQNPTEADIQKSDAILTYEKRFLKAINDDLNMPQAIAILHEVLKSDVLEPTDKLILSYDFDSVFGLDLKNIEDKKVSEEEQESIKDLLTQRDAARANKDWTEADRIRDEIQSRGYILKDTPDGTVVEKA